MADQKICENLRKYNSLLRAYNDLYRGFGSDYDLADCALWILYVLRESEMVYTQRDICGLLQQPKQSINTSLKKLERAGLLELRYAKSSRKSKEIYLTPEGVALARETADKIIAAERSALSALTDEEQDTFLSLFDKYIHALCAEIEPLRKSGDQASCEKTV